MDHILLCTNHIPLTTSIHNSFIEDYMLEANGSYVKVYLYLAKCIQYGETGLSISSLADRMDNTEKDILRALQYWEKKKLLKINRDNNGEIVGIDMLAPAIQKSTASNEMPPADISANSTKADVPNVTHANTDMPGISHVSSDVQAANSDVQAAHSDTQVAGLSETAIPDINMPNTNVQAVEMADTPRPELAMPDTNIPDTNIQVETAISKVVSMPVKKAENKAEITVSLDQRKMLAENKEFIWICNVIESYLDRTLNSNESELVSYLYGTLHFSKDLLLHLYDYCISLGKTNCKYIQKVALSWDEQGIHTPEEAEQATNAYNTAYTSVARSLALDRALAPIEKKRVDCWQKEWGMDLSVIIEACNRTILKLHKVDFNYIDGILDRWHQAGVHTLQGVERADQTYMQSKAEKTYAASEQKAAKPKNQFQQFQQRETSSQEVNELERKLLFH